MGFRPGADQYGNAACGYHAPALRASNDPSRRNLCADREPMRPNRTRGTSSAEPSALQNFSCSSWYLLLYYNPSVLFRYFLVQNRVCCELSGPTKARGLEALRIGFSALEERLRWLYSFYRFAGGGNSDSVRVFLNACRFATKASRSGG